MMGVAVSRATFTRLCTEVSDELEAGYRQLWERLGLSVDWTQHYTTIGARAQRASQLAFLRLLEFTLAQDHVAEDEKAAWPALDGDSPLQRWVVSGGGGVHRDEALVDIVEPAAVAEAHLERRRHCQQPPAVAAIDQRTQAARPHDVVGIARNREELVEGRVADRQLRAEHPMHPARDTQRRVVGQHGLAGAQQRAVTARHHPLLVTQHDVAVVRRDGGEEGQQFPGHPPFVEALRTALRQRRFTQWRSDDG